MQKVVGVLAYFYHTTWHHNPMTFKLVFCLSVHVTRKYCIMLFILTIHEIVNSSDARTWAPPHMYRVYQSLCNQLHIAEYFLRSKEVHNYPRKSNFQPFSALYEQLILHSQLGLVDCTFMKAFKGHCKLKTPPSWAEVEI